MKLVLFALVALVHPMNDADVRILFPVGNNLRHAEGLELQIVARIDDEDGIHLRAEPVSHAPTSGPEKGIKLRDKGAAAAPGSGSRSHIDRQRGDGWSGNPLLERAEIRRKGERPESMQGRSNPPAAFVTTAQAKLAGMQ